MPGGQGHENAVTHVFIVIPRLAGTQVVMSTLPSLSPLTFDQTTTAGSGGQVSSRQLPARPAKRSGNGHVDSAGAMDAASEGLSQLPWYLQTGFGC